MMRDQHGGGEPVSAARIVDVARDVVRRMEPEELVVFDGVAEAWLAGDLPVRGRTREPGAAVGFGIDAVLFSELLFPIITGALGQVLGTPITERLQRGTRRRRARPTAPSASPQPDPPLTAGQLRDIHDVCQRGAAALGLPPERAVLLADLVTGGLVTPPDQAGS